MVKIKNIKPSEEGFEYKLIEDGGRINRISTESFSVRTYIGKLDNRMNIKYDALSMTILYFITQKILKISNMYERIIVDIHINTSIGKELIKTYKTCTNKDIGALFNPFQLDGYNRINIAINIDYNMSFENICMYFVHEFGHMYDFLVNYKGTYTQRCEAFKKNIEINSAYLKKLNSTVISDNWSTVEMNAINYAVENTHAFKQALNIGSNLGIPVLKDFFTFSKYAKAYPFEHEILEITKLKNVKRIFKEMFKRIFTGSRF